MTVQELQQLYYLEKLILNEQERLDNLRAAVDLKSPALSDMPRAPGARDKLGDLMPEIIDQEREIEKALEEYEETREEILRYINRVPNARIKLIMIKKYIENLSWEEVADAIGGRETGDSARKALNRYIETEQSYMGG